MSRSRAAPFAARPDAHRVTPSGYGRWCGITDSLFGVRILRDEHSLFSPGGGKVSSIMESKRHRRNRLICGIGETPFVHSAVLFLFVVLVFFFTLPVPTCHDNVGIDLSKAVHPVRLFRAKREDAMTISVLRDDKIFFGRDVIRAEEIRSEIQKSIASGSERKVYIRADARANYSWVEEVIDGVHAAGVEKIAFVTN